MRDLIKKIKGLLLSNRLWLFVAVALSVMLPTLIMNVVVTNMSVQNYVGRRVESYKASNTLLKNSIINQGYMKNQQSQTINTLLDVMSAQYNCRIELISGQYRILRDTASNEEGKININENVVNCLSTGKYISNEQITDGFFEFVVPITEGPGTDSDSTEKNVEGALYTKYSADDVQRYKEDISRNSMSVNLIMLILSLLLAYVCTFVAEKPVKFLERYTDRIAEGYTDNIPVTGPTEQRNISENLNRMLDRLNDQKKLRDEFVSNVSHELKTPITSMKVLADSLKGQTGLPEELYQEFLSDISDEIDRENEIITDLLGLVRLEKSSSGAFEQTNINELVEDILKRVKPLASEKNIELIFESFRPVIADVDPKKFDTMTTNLVENAIKYNNTDGTVTVTLNSDHQYFYLNVADTGIGISEEEVEHVFERFYRVDKARDRETGGTGLGLAIAKEIVTLHKGIIKVHSKEGEGTTFSVRIPLKYMTE